MNVNPMIDQFCQWYAGTPDDAAARRDQWARILNRDPSQPFALVNFFKLREIARYEPDQGIVGSISGQDTFTQYSSVSIPTMERVGGTFVLVGPILGSFIGPDEDWDLIAVGRYPNLDAFLGLHRDEQYRAAYYHRTAACERQKVMICAG